MLAAGIPAQNHPHDPSQYNLDAPHPTEIPGPTRPESPLLARSDRKLPRAGCNLPVSPVWFPRQIFLALDSNSCHNIIKLEQKFIVRRLGRPIWCNCFTALKSTPGDPGFAVVYFYTGNGSMWCPLSSAGDG